MADVINLIGILGMSMVLLAYFWLQAGKVTSTSPRYLWMNLIGTMGVLLSLCWFPNLPCFVLESIWVGISVYGLIKHTRKKSA